jgi:aldehyde dehydrogenase (NAD+)
MTAVTSLKARHEAAKASLPKIASLIGSDRVTVGSAGTFQQINPTTGQAQTDVPLGGADEVNAAVAAARAALPAWRSTPPTLRRDLLNRLAQRLQDNADAFALISVLEVGMPLSTATMIARGTCEFVSYYAGWADKFTGDVSRFQPNEFTYTLPEPYGVIGVVVTWNGPLLSLGMKVAPALAAGNTVVIKPAEFTPFTLQLFVELCLEVGIPPGVVNLVHGGAEAGSALTSHPGVDKITFTGGPATAQRILESAAKTMRPAVLELGGKSANLLFADANMAEALPYSVQMCMMMAGQGCAFPTRLLVQDTIYDQTLQGLQQIISQLPIGDPLNAGTLVGPLVNHAAVSRVMGFIDRAKAEGAGKLVIGGKRMEGELAEGCFIAPTVFADVDPRSEIATKEIFGPVLSVMKFSTEEEAIRLANATDYGLAAYVQSNDSARIRRLASALHAGTICVNGAIPVTPHAPFGGIGLSGMGKEGGRAGIEEFISQKTVHMRG